MVCEPLFMLKITDRNYKDRFHVTLKRCVCI